MFQGDRKCDHQSPGEYEVDNLAEYLPPPRMSRQWICRKSVPRELAPSQTTRCLLHMKCQMRAWFPDFAQAWIPALGLHRQQQGIGESVYTAAGHLLA